MSDVANKLSAKLTTAEVPNTRAGDAALSMSSTSLTVANTSFDSGDTKGDTGLDRIVFTEAVSNFTIHFLAVKY
ncbi:hypothetical protein GBAR_LOCUS6223, partial [Geodia barretti]